LVLPCCAPRSCVVRLASLRVWSSVFERQQHQAQQQQQTSQAPRRIGPARPVLQAQPPSLRSRPAKNAGSGPQWFPPLQLGFWACRKS
jgi:hypothetical protein